MLQTLLNIMLSFTLASPAADPCAQPGPDCCGPCPDVVRILCVEPTDDGCRGCAELTDGRTACFVCSPAGCEITPCEATPAPACGPTSGC